MDVIDAVAHDWRPSRVEARAAILAAVDQVAAQHDGLVHVAWVRPLLPEWIDQHQVGATVCALVRQRVLAGTGRYLPNGNHASRNRTKPSEIRRLTRPLTEVPA